MSISKKVVFSTEEAYAMVKNTYNTTVLFSFSVMLVVLSTLSDIYPVIYWTCLFIFFLFSYSSRLLKLLAPLGSWFFYCYFVIHSLFFVVLFFYVFYGMVYLVFILIVAIFIYNFLLGSRWRELQIQYNISGDDLLRK